MRRWKQRRQSRDSDQVTGVPIIHAYEEFLQEVIAVVRGDRRGQGLGNILGL